MSVLRLPRTALETVVGQFGYDLVMRRQTSPYPVDFSESERRLWDAVSPYTMTSPGSTIALSRLVAHVSQQQIPGAFVECGVWKGGSMAAIARTLHGCGDTRRELWLYDVFGVFRRATSEADVNPFGVSASVRASEEGDNWGGVPMSSVQQVLHETAYPDDLIRFVPGYVEDTIPAQLPDEIALLRLDTDFYESTLHELRHMYPLVASGGVIIIDDYGYWRGQRQAVDEYLAAHGLSPLLVRLDAGPAMFVKP